MAVEWADAPAHHDYHAAEDYLSLVMPLEAAAATVADLRDAAQGYGVIHYRANDLLRAARLELLSVADPAVRQDLHRIERGVPLSPVLLVRSHGGLIIADGYHRISAAYHYDEDMQIPCVIV